MNEEPLVSVYFSPCDNRIPLDREQAFANAALIAAAPTMLQALVELRDAPWNSMCGRANQLVEDAINAAIGDSLHNALDQTPPPKA